MPNACDVDQPGLLQKACRVLADTALNLLCLHKRQKYQNAIVKDLVLPEFLLLYTGSERMVVTCHVEEDVEKDKGL